MSQINRRQFFLATWALLLAAPLTALGQITGRMLRIAFLDDASEQSRREALRAFAGRLAEFGFAEGRNLIIDARYAPGELERLPGLAEELVALKPDIMVTTDTPTTRAAMRATSSIPIVFIASADPVGAGLVSSLSRPGGNVTGSMILTAEYRAKWLELLRQIAPKAKRVAYIADFRNPFALRGFEQLQEAARPFKVTIYKLDGHNHNELERSLDSIRRERLDALIVGVNAVLLDFRERILLFAEREKLPAIYALREFVVAGGLLYYGSDDTMMASNTADYVHRILQGAKPSELPVDRRNVVRLVVNLKTARALGIKIPQSILLRADEIIE